MSNSSDSQQKWNTRTIVEDIYKDIDSLRQYDQQLIKTLETQVAYHLETTHKERKARLEAEGKVCELEAQLQLLNTQLGQFQQDKMEELHLKRQMALAQYRLQCTQDNTKDDNIYQSDEDTVDYV